MKFKTKLIEFDKENKNGRIYPKNLMDNILEQIDSKQKPLYGELEQDNVNFDISMNNISHTIENVYIKDNAIYGDISILDTAKGKIAKELLEKNGSIGIASRGMGTVNADGTIGDDYKVLTFDIVTNSSFDIYINKKSKDYYTNKIQELKETWEKLEWKNDSLTNLLG